MPTYAIQQTTLRVNRMSANFTKNICNRDIYGDI